MFAVKMKNSVLTLFLVMGFSTNSSAEAANPDQPRIDDLNNKTAVLTAETAYLNAVTANTKAEFPALPENFGKTGVLTVDPAERDKFHVTARTAESFKKAAEKLKQVLRLEKGKLVLINEGDRMSIPIYLAEKFAIDRLYIEINKVAGDKINNEGFGASISAAGVLLNQLSSFSKIFKTDKSVSFTGSELPDEHLHDLLAADKSLNILYPSASVDSLFASADLSSLGSTLNEVLSRKTELQNIAQPEKAAQAKVLLAELDSLATRLASTDSVTKLPMLFSMLRGELAILKIKEAEGRIMTIKTAAKGGASLKTSSIWRNDRLYASGGVVVTYRITSSEGILKADSFTEESEYTRVNLN